MHLHLIVRLAQNIENIKCEDCQVSEYEEICFCELFEMVAEQFLFVVQKALLILDMKPNLVHFQETEKVENTKI